MARRLSFAVAQSITIVGFFMSAFILVSLVSVASSSIFRNAPAENHALSQAFYYAIIAAGIYCIIALLLVATVIGAYRGHYEKEFRLTISQRTLMLQTISFMVYLLLGALVYKVIEDWNFLDAVFWADFTLLTVGIGGDFTPKTHLGRGLLFPYAIGGIVTVGLVVGSIRTLILERGKEKMETRMTEKKRERTLKTFNREKRTIKTGWFKTMEFSQEGLTEPQRREQEFKLMREIQERASSRRRWVALALSTTAAMTLWLVGAAVFWQSEREQGWSYFVSLYFAYTSLLTIGYGDFTVNSNSGRPFFVFWSLLAVPTLTILISNMGDTVVKMFSEFTIWVGSLTVLPGEEGIRATIKGTLHNITGGKLLNNRDFRTDKPPGFLGHSAEPQKKHTHEDSTVDRVACHLEDEELAQAEEADEHGDVLERDIKFYHYVLVRELRSVMKDAEASPPKQYSYDEWRYYLRLIGEDEEDVNRHRAPPIKPKRHRDTTHADGQEQREESQEVGTAAGAGGNLKWSWLGTRSPLMGSKSEAEWILEKLALQLEKELKSMQAPNQEREKPPISMSSVRKKND
ncbi:hypothetical protein LTS18_003886 [Coniosporium uncinatum]|uniref:Uncharacterized protein n=1 Tax=Coniosporium uncinatum TaxID=93489 RepID=A0ACC3DBC7_9PEZI|nr:hypothetical protein LTS18_003886 [Coniosporium uncinatum]